MRRSIQGKRRMYSKGLRRPSGGAHTRLADRAEDPTVHAIHALFCCRQEGRFGGMLLCSHAQQELVRLHRAAYLREKIIKPPNHRLNISGGRAE